jgi:hypothetical protein
MPPLPSQEFIARFRSRLPADVARSFSAEQLAAIEQAFGTRYRARHLLAWQGTFRLGKGRYYVTLYFGRDERARSAAAAANGIMLGLALATAVSFSIGFALWALA